MINSLKQYDFFLARNAEFNTISSMKRQSRLLTNKAETNHSFYSSRLASLRSGRSIGAKLKQLEMEFERKVIRFVPKARQYMLDYELASIFNKYCTRFAHTREKLRDAGIIQLGDFVKLSEKDFRQFTKNETLVKQVKDRLNQMGFEFDMKTPGWKPRSGHWRN